MQDLTVIWLSATPSWWFTGPRSKSWLRLSFKTTEKEQKPSDVDFLKCLQLDPHLTSFKFTTVDIVKLASLKKFLISSNGFGYPNSQHARSNGYLTISDSRDDLQGQDQSLLRLQRKENKNQVTLNQVSRLDFSSDPNTEVASINCLNFQTSRIRSMQDLTVIWLSATPSWW